MQTVCSATIERTLSQYKCSCSSQRSDRLQYLDRQSLLHPKWSARKPLLHQQSPAPKLRAFSRQATVCSSNSTRAEVLHVSGLLPLRLQHSQISQKQARRRVKGTTTASAVGPQTLGTVWGGAIQKGVLQATVSATFKLFLVCGFTGYLLHSGRISDDTAPVLSKVAFNMMLPCMLFTRVASTLANNFQWSFLGIPLVALIQLGVGALGGELASRMVDGTYGRKLGWHPMNPAKSANAIAMSTAAASGIPQVAPVLLPRPHAPPQGTRQLVTSCCIFGNSFTLPLVFLMSLLPGAAFDRATGYTAMFLVGWSPILWSYGYQLLGAAAPPNPEDQQGPLHTFDEHDISTAQMALLASPGRLEPDTAGATLQAKLAARRQISAIKHRLEKIFNPPLIGIVAGIAIGISPLGAPLFCPAPIAQAAAASLPIELGTCLGVIKLGVEALGLLAGASLALQSTVLAASLFQKVPEEEEQRPGSAPVLALPDGEGTLASNWTRPSAIRPALPPGANASQAEQEAWKKGRSAAQLDQPPRNPKSSMQPVERPNQNILSILLPQTWLEWKMIAAISCVRFLMVPLASMAAVGLCAQWGWLPADPVCRLALLVQGVMPPAQNLALLVNLRKSTHFLAPRLAKLLLRLYVIAVVPVTLWITVFVAGLPGGGLAL